MGVGPVPRRDVTLQWLTIFLLAWNDLGILIDAWTHAHYGFAIESFFIPPHYVLYSAWFALGLLLVIYAFRSVQAGIPRRHWWPRGYNIVAIGVVVFYVGGAFDFYWHSVYGFEANFPFTTSPSHLTLVAGGILTTLGFIRYSLHRRELTTGNRSSFVAALPLTLGVAFMLTLVLWPTWYYDPLTIDYASGGAIAHGLDAFKGIEFTSSAGQVAGVTGMILISLILVAFVVVSLYRWRLPVGAATLILTYPAVFRTPVTDTTVYLPAAVATGIVVDAVWAWMRRGGEARLSSPQGYRLIATLLPIVLLCFYFVIMSIRSGGVVWPVTVWPGSIILSSAAGLLLSFGLVQSD